MTYSKANTKRAIAVLSHMERLLGRPYGWVRRRMTKRIPQKGYNAFCLIGANDAVMAEEFGGLSFEVYAKTRRQVYDALLVEIGTTPDSRREDKMARSLLIMWNDMRGRSKREVEAAVRRAREKLEQSL